MRLKLSLSIFLIKKEYTKYKEILKDEEKNIKFHYLKDGLEFEGIVVSGKNKVGVPNWNNLLETLAKDYKVQSTQSTRAILFLKKSGRTFAFTFGYGRHMLKEEAYVRNFGLRVILNNTKRDSIKSIDSTTVHEKPFHRRIQASHSSRLEEFNLRDTRTLFRGITAEAINISKYGKFLTGKDHIKLTLDFSKQNLQKLCESLLKDFESNKYERYFPEISRINLVADPDVIEALNNRLIQRFKDKNNIYLIIPEIIDWSKIDGFKYTPNGELLSNPSIDNFWEYKNLDKNNLTYDKLKTHYLKLIKNEQTIDKWSIVDCISMEVVYENKQYIYSIGDWFEINDDLIESVNNYIENIPICEMKFPEINGLHEKHANMLFEKEIPDLLNMDRNNIRFDSSNYEVCDLLSKQNQFIHVKWWDNSATLSHLFSQGKVSAEILVREKSQRLYVNNKIKELNNNFKNIIKIKNFTPNDYTVVFAIIYKENKSIKERLPFFSKLNLKQSVSELRNLGYNVELAHIKSSCNRLKTDENKELVQTLGLED